MAGLVFPRSRKQAEAMRYAILILALLLHAGSVAPAFACGCELICPEGEEYSDDTERCEPIAKPIG